MAKVLQHFSLVRYMNNVHNIFQWAYGVLSKTFCANFDFFIPIFIVAKVFLISYNEGSACLSYRIPIIIYYFCVYDVINFLYTFSYADGN